MTRPNYPGVRARRPRKPKRDHFKMIVAAIVVSLIVAMMGLSFGISRWTEKTETFTVTRILDQPISSCSTSNGHRSCETKHTYLIFSDHGTYKNKDSLWFFKFNSSDLIGELQDGHTYRCTTTGFRLGFTSSYRNLISCDEVGK